MDQCLEASLVEELNPTWHSAAGVEWGTVTVTMAEMWESFVKVELGYRCFIAYEIVIGTVSDLIVTLHQPFHFMTCNSMQISCTQ